MSQLPKSLTRALIVLFAGSISIVVLMWVVPDILEWKRQENQQKVNPKGTSENNIKSELFLMKFK